MPASHEVRIGSGAPAVRPGRIARMSVTTPRLILDPIDAEAARRVRARTPRPDEHWAADYPFVGDLAAIGAFLSATERHGEQRPFGYYQVRLRSEGVAIGGIGFKGPPQDDAVEVGYGLAPSARGRGYATEALQAMVGLAGDLGVATVRADTDLDNVASQRVLEKAGFRRTHADGGACHFEIGTAVDGRYSPGCGRVDGPGPSPVHRLGW
jgi:RimJ/RimL family protein N-acetyltransferase